MSICIICNTTCSNNQVLSRHISKHHNMSGKEYYDKYLKKEGEGVCIICGKETSYRGISCGYLVHCSNKCSQMDPLTTEQRENTCLKRYGNKKYTYSEDFYNKTTQTNMKKYGSKWFIGSETGKAKINKTCQEKYGSNYPLENPEIKKKSEKTQKDKYGNNYMSSDEFKQKSKETNNIKYGSDYYMQTEEFNKKSYETKRKRKRYGMQTEDNCYNMLNSIYEVKRQYKTEIYPYHCDFYINSLDLYIELNFFWTHGGHWFDSNNQNDLDILNLWINKSKEHSIYNSAVNVWSNVDLEKRNCAIKNNLNYAVIWNMNQFNNFIKDLSNNKPFIGLVDYNFKEAS